jgi:hypothetical protein
MVRINVKRYFSFTVRSQAFVTSALVSICPDHEEAFLPTPVTQQAGLTSLKPAVPPVTCREMRTVIERLYFNKGDSPRKK